MHRAGGDTLNDLFARAEADLERFRRARSRSLLSESLVSELSAAAATNFFQASLDAGFYLRPSITLLCELSSLSERSLAAIGLRALFPGLIERLNDSFDPAACALHDRILAQMVEHFRRLPEAEALDQMLRSDRLGSEQDLLDRKARLGVLQTSLPPSRVKKILLLSRVTIGADVAVTSVILRRLREIAPQAELVWLGPAKLADLYRDGAGLRLSAIAYERGAGVLDRLLSWVPLREAVERERSGLGEDELWIVDPDSRMTQLGMLPLGGGDRGYYFFESRSYRARNRERLGELADDWCARQWNVNGHSERPAYPFLDLPPEKLALGEAIAGRLRGASARNRGAERLIVVSLGVGGNELKRIAGGFEEDLIRALLGEATLILDKGGSAEEREGVERIVARLRGEGVSIAEAAERDARLPDCRDARLVVWEGGIGSLAALIAQSDCYIGYDSAGQHLAAALGIPTLTIFVNNATPLFSRRWHPTGPGAIRVWEMTPEEARSRDKEVLVAEAVDQFRSLMASAPNDIQSSEHKAKSEERSV